MPGASSPGHQREKGDDGNNESGDDRIGAIRDALSNVVR
jgi:hypothetical protein